MSAGNVQVVREAVAALDRAFESYWRAPRSLAEATESGDWPEWNEATRYVHPQIEWQTVFLGSTVHGRATAARVWDDYLQWASDYRPRQDHRPGDQLTLLRRLHDPRRMIGRLEEYTTCEEAMSAAGVSEQA